MDYPSPKYTMLDISPFTDQQWWWRLCDASLSLPTPLAKADLSKPFLYDRAWGVFYAPPGHHQLGMVTLLAFQLGVRDGIDAAKEVGQRGLSGAADHYLEFTPGVCFRSSVGKSVLAGCRGALSAVELRLIGPVEYMFEKPFTPWEVLRERNVGER